jgi:hypothetical protein
VRVGDFSREQNAYLNYHRVNVFKHPPLERWTTARSANVAAVFVPSISAR